MKLGVSLYSYQQSQFFKELMLEDQIREVGENLPYADGIEIVDEMSLRYPEPGHEFVKQWFGWMEKYGTRPVTMDVAMDVLQFRTHVMSYDEVASRLIRDMHLAKRLGFSNVRVLSTCPFEVMKMALPTAEKLDLKLGKEVHQPMRLEGQQVTEIIDYVEQTGTEHMGIVPDFGIFGFKPSEVILAQYERRGAQPQASAASEELAELIRVNKAPFDVNELIKQTAGNLRAAFKQFIQSGQCEAGIKPVFEAIKVFTDERVPSAQMLDYIVVSEAILLSNTSLDTMRELAKHVVSVHGKFNYMSEIEGKTGQFHEASIDYEGALKALSDGGFTGYINSEYEGQRYLQDRTRAEMMSEVDQVRRHHEMLRRLLNISA